ncbi:hypothetical protein IQ06DRAFT_381174 [Phaeosphaeriaceae sp. SRC1lsM3a]|nr:hypothetical protein IQ06DRAFT_381174 [Stagonospora sp. SRC1lsM3a]
MTPCDGTATSEKWCCGDKADCCDAENAHKAVTVPRKLGQKFSANSTSASASSSPTPGSSQQSSSASDVKWKIGLGVGIGIGFPIMLALGILLGMFCFKRKGEAQSSASEVQGNEVAQGHVKRQATDDTVELMTPVSELWGDGRCKAELA